MITNEIGICPDYAFLVEKFDRFNPTWETVQHLVPIIVGTFDYPVDRGGYISDSFVMKMAADQAEYAKRLIHCYRNTWAGMFYHMADATADLFYKNDLLSNWSNLKAKFETWCDKVKASVLKEWMPAKHVWVLAHQTELLKYLGLLRGDATEPTWRK